MGRRQWNVYDKKITISDIQNNNFESSGINIYSFFEISTKLFWISENKFVISEILAH